MKFHFLDRTFSNEYIPVKGFLLLLSFLCSPLVRDDMKLNAQTKNDSEIIQNCIEYIQKKMAPDLRVAVFQVRGEFTDSKTLIINGKTSLPEIASALNSELTAKGFRVVDSIKTLPDPQALFKYGLINLSVANLRTHPAHSSELATQALLGTPVVVLEEKDGWYHIQTPDNYIAWVDNRALKPLPDSDFRAWKKAKRYVFLPVFGFCYSQPDIQSPTVSDLVAGDLLAATGESGNFYKVRFPDGRSGFIPKDQVMDFSQWLHRPDPSAEDLISTARKFLGFPYLWGGTSTKGMDCSGFIKTTWFLNGTILQRDASQQVLYGQNAGQKLSKENMQAGDLLFFGTPGQNGASDRITHVAMVMDKNQYIHASGFVRISEIPDISEEKIGTGGQVLLRCKRYLGHVGEPGIIRVKDHPLYTDH